MAFRFVDPDGNPLVRRAVTTILPETTAEEAAARRRLYPHVLEEGDGRVHLSRVAPGTLARLGYLRAHGHFVPGDPWQALVGLLVLGDPQVLASAEAVLDTALNTR